MKLKVIYILTEQLYIRSVLTVKAVMGVKELIILIKNMFGCLFIFLYSQSYAASVASSLTSWLFMSRSAC